MLSAQSIHNSLRFSWNTSVIQSRSQNVAQLVTSLQTYRRRTVPKVAQQMTPNHHLVSSRDSDTLYMSPHSN